MFCWSWYNKTPFFLEVADKCDWCPAPSAVQVIQTNHGEIRNQLVGSNCHILAPHMISGASVESDNSGIFMGDPVKAEPTFGQINEPLPSSSSTKR